jgi:hypothetical protein
MATELCVLAKKFGSDKCPEILHCYTPTYHSLLNDRREKIKLMLEIGIGHSSLMAAIVGSHYIPGASLRMWKAYFPNAKITGCDIHRPVISTYDEERIHTFYADQSDEQSLDSLITNDLQQFGAHLDIILDDGSHVEEHQILSFRVLWKYIAVGGLYIIEDVWINRLDYFATLPKEFGFTDVKVLHIHQHPRDAQGFIVFEKISTA